MVCWRGTPPTANEVVNLYEMGAGAFITVNETDLTGRNSENIKRVRSIRQEDDHEHRGPFPLDPSLVVEFLTGDTSPLSGRQRRSGLPTSKVAPTLPP